MVRRGPHRLRNTGRSLAISHLTNELHGSPTTAPVKGGLLWCVADITSPESAQDHLLCCLNGGSVRNQERGIEGEATRVEGR